MRTHVAGRYVCGASPWPLGSPVFTRILVVDDYRDAADSLVELLQLHGYVARAAYDLRAALDCAPMFRPELVLCEPLQRAADGFSLCRLLRQLPQLSGVHFAAVTTLDATRHAARLRTAGFEWHFLKPVDWDGLLITLTHFDATTAPIGGWGGARRL